MTLTALREICAAYLGKSTGSDLTINSRDLFLDAANNARRRGERLHNFEYARVSGTLSIDGVTGGALSAVTFGNTTQRATITGTLSPDWTGVYLRIGLDSDGYPVYMQEATGATYVLARIGNDTTSFWRFKKLSADGQAWQSSTDSTNGDSTTAGVYTPLGGGSGNATVTVTGTTITLKEVSSVSRIHSSGVYIPLPFNRTDTSVERSRTIEDVSGFYAGNLRYPSDADLLLNEGDTTIYQRGQTLYIYPQATTGSNDLSVHIEGFRWLATYTSSDYSTDNPDFFMEFGTDYMQWAIICELNHHFEKFVPRQEGSLPPPERIRDEAWREFLLWDAYLIDPNAAI